MKESSRPILSSACAGTANMADTRSASDRSSCELAPAAEAGAESDADVRKSGSGRASSRGVEAPVREESPASQARAQGTACYKKAEYREAFDVRALTCLQTAYGVDARVARLSAMTLGGADARGVVFGAVDIADGRIACCTGRRACTVSRRIACLTERLRARLRTVRPVLCIMHKAHRSHADLSPFCSTTRMR